MTSTLPRTAAVVVAVACLYGQSYLYAGAQAPPGTSPQTASPSAAITSDELLITAGKSVVVTSDRPIERVAVGVGEIAEAAAVGPREVLVHGKTPGETTLIVWQEGGGKLYFDVVVRASRMLAEDRLSGIRAQVEREVPGQNLDITVEGDAVFLRGRVRDLATAERAASIAGTLGKVVNLLYVDVPAVESQILLKVKFATVDRTALRELGLNVFSTGAGNTIGTVSTQQFPHPSVETDDQGRVTVNLSDVLNVFLFNQNLNLGATIRALQRRALVEVLAEPNVLAINGRQASFLAGGEFPYPVVQGTGGTGGNVAISIVFREFGVRLNFLPVITPRGTIRLQVAPEVSSLDFANGISLQGFRIPALAVRKINTAVELNEGQSFAIAGLLDNRLTQTLERIPYIGDIPVLGRLFRSRAINRSNQELLVIVTPELVRPIPAGQPTPMLKFPEEFLPPNTAPELLRTPGVQITGPVPVEAVPAIPMETLREAVKPDPPLQDTKTSAPIILAPTGAPGTTDGSGAAPSAPAPAAAPAAAPTAAPAAPAGTRQPGR